MRIHTHIDKFIAFLSVCLQVGALTVMCRGVVHPYDGDLTFVGQVLASLPVDVRVGKLLILGHVFGCLGECIVIGEYGIIMFLSLRQVMCVCACVDQTYLATITYGFHFSLINRGCSFIETVLLNSEEPRDERLPVGNM